MCSDCNEELKTMNSLGVYRRHIKTFAQTAKPIYDLRSLDLWKKKNVTSTKHSPRGNSGQISSSSPVEWETQHQSALEVLIDPRLRCSIYSTYWCVTGWPRCGFVPRTEWLYASNRLRIKNPDSIRTQLSYAFRQAGIPVLEMGSDRTVQGLPLLRPWICGIHRQQSLNLCVNVCQTKCHMIEWVGELADFNFEIR